MEPVPAQNRTSSSYRDFAAERGRRAVAMPSHPARSDVNSREVASMCHTGSDESHLPMKNQAQLIAYVDRLPGGTFRDLQQLLDGPFAGRSAASTCCRSSIRSTAPTPASIRSITRRSIRGSARGTTSPRSPRGTDVMADVIVNHVSAARRSSRTTTQRGDASPYAGLFLTYRRVFPARRAASRICSRCIRRVRACPSPSTRPHDGQRSAAVDDLHQRADRYRRAAPGGQAISRRRARRGCTPPASGPSGSMPSATRSRRPAPAAS